MPFIDDLEELEELNRDERIQPIPIPRHNVNHENPAVIPIAPEAVHERQGAPPPPPPPPPPPIPPRPKLWRFPEAEFGSKGVRR